jgi:hypothetical protein
MTDTKDDTPVTAGQMNGDEPISDEKYQRNAASIPKKSSLTRSSRARRR